MRFKQVYHISILIFLCYSTTFGNIFRTQLPSNNRLPDYKYHRQQLSFSSQLHRTSAQLKHTYLSSMHVFTTEEIVEREIEKAQRELKEKEEKEKLSRYKRAVRWKKICNLFSLHKMNEGIDQITQQYYGISDDTSSSQSSLSEQTVSSDNSNQAQLNLLSKQDSVSIEKSINHISRSHDKVSQTIEKQSPVIQNKFDTFQASLMQHPGPEKVDRYMKRLDAFKEIQQDPTKMFEMDYTINEHAQEILEKNGIDVNDVNQFYGNMLQQVIHQEYVDWLNTVPDEKISADYDELMSALYDIHEGGIDLNKNGQIVQSMSMSDFLWGAGCILRGAACGVGDYGKAFVNMVLHPIQTGYDMLHTSFMVGYLYGSILEECKAIVVMSFTDPEKAIIRRNKDIQKFRDLVQQGMRVLNDMSGEEKTRHCTRVIADVFLTKKVARGCEKLAILASKQCGAALSEIVKFENFLDLIPAAAIVEESQIAKKTKNVLSVAAEIDPAYKMPNKIDAIINSHLEKINIAQELSQMTPKAQKYLTWIQESESLGELSHLYGKETLFEAFEILKCDKKPKAFKQVREISDMLLKLNSNPNRMNLKYDKFGCITEESLNLGIKKIIKEEIKIAKKINSFLVQHNPKSVWAKITPTDGLIPNSTIPKSFIIEIENQKFWIHPNVTEHFEELLRSEQINKNFLSTMTLPPEQTILFQEELLSDLYEAIKKGIHQSDTLYIEGQFNKWQIEIGEARIPNGQPTIFHAHHVDIMPNLNKGIK